jgi:Na+-transporting methylmalonyl-CoA/oxaloacetate decarboxylase gamma subunit
MFTDTVFHSHAFSVVFLFLAIILIVIWYLDRRDEKKEMTEIDQDDTTEAEQKALTKSGLEFRRKLLIATLVCVLLCICSV